jgi:hypothetical protein
MDGVQDSRIENNLIYENHSSGISLYQIDAGQPARNNVVVNNTIYIASDGRWALNIQDGSTGNTVRNNILLTDHETRGAIDISADSLTGFTSDYNVIGPPDDEGLGPPFSRGDMFHTHTLIADPDALFVDWNIGNFELLATAIARNAGTSSFAPLFDLAGKPRPIGGAFDIGAYEFGVALIGDYNADGTVDAADYSVWRNTLGDEGDGLAADGDGDRRIDEDDYGIWKRNYGRSAAGGGGGSHVPEPTTIALLLIAVFGIAKMQARQEPRPPRSR